MFTLLASCMTEKTMGSSKRNANYNEEEIRTPKYLQIFINPDNIPYNTNQNYLDIVDSSAITTDLIMQSSKSNKSSRVSLIQNLNSFLMTKNSVESSINISEILSMRQHLYYKLSICRYSYRILPSAAEVYMVV